MTVKRMVGVLIGIVVIAALVWAAVFSYEHKSETVQTVQVTTPSGSADYKNATYVINGKPVTLVNGSAATPAAPGSASQIATQYFGDDVTGDLNGDGLPDVAFILTQSDGGSGTFYYVVAALKTATGYQGTNAVLLGDRIAPQNIELQGSQLVVNYADRKLTDPMTTAPSMGMTTYLVVNGTTLEQVSASH